MGMSTHVIGFVAPDADYKKKVAAWRACEAAGVDPPQELEEFFGGPPPSDEGMQIDIQAAIREWRDDSRSGYEVDIRKLPKHVTIVRFYNSW